ncbi:MAG: hypothetical protein ACOZCL_02150 [Bacillota bacterium]
MRIDIEPFHEPHRNCLEDIYASIAIWLKREYILMHAYSWDFGFSASNDRYKLLGHRISTCRNGIAVLEKAFLLEHYLGIRITQYVQQFEENLSIIKRETSEGRPVAIYINGFWCNWNPAYQKHDIAHYCLAVDIEEDYIVCTDPYFELRRVRLPIENYKKEFGKVITFAFLDDMDNEDWSKIILSCANKPLIGINGNSDFANMRKLAEEIKNSDSIDKEFEEFPNIEFSPFLMTLYSIGWGRKKNASVFLHLGNKYNVEELKLYADKLEQACSKWLAIKNLIIKYHITGFTKDSLNKLSTHIHEAANYEENLSYEIIQGITSYIAQGSMK